MPISQIHCPISHANVLRVTDLEGAVLRMICVDYDEQSGACRLKRRASEGGPLARLLEGADEGRIGSRGDRCDLA